MCVGDGGGLRSVDPNCAELRRAVSLHSGDHELPGAPHLRRLPARHLLETYKRAGTSTITFVALWPLCAQCIHIGLAYVSWKLKKMFPF